MAHALDIGEISAGGYRLRPLGADAAEELRRVTADPAVTAVIPFLPEPFGLDQARALLARQADGRDLYLGIRDAARDALLGVVGVHLRGAAEVEIGYWLPGRHHGRGIASVAVPAAAVAYAAAFPDRQLIAECRPDNAVSRRVLAKAGFVAAGVPGTRAKRDLYRYRA